MMEIMHRLAAVRFRLANRRRFRLRFLSFMKLYSKVVSLWIFST